MPQVVNKSIELVCDHCGNSTIANDRELLMDSPFLGWWIVESYRELFSTKGGKMYFCGPQCLKGWVNGPHM